MCSKNKNSLFQQYFCCATHIRHTSTQGCVYYIYIGTRLFHSRVECFVCAHEMTIFLQNILVRHRSTEVTRHPIVFSTKRKSHINARVIIYYTTTWKSFTILPSPTLQSSIGHEITQPRK